MTMLGTDELQRRLGYHPAGPATAPVFDLNRAVALLVAEVWDQMLPPGREAALALTSLQDALMWANAAVACNLDPNEGERPVVDVADRLDALLDRLEGPTLTRSGPASPPSGPDRPEEVLIDPDPRARWVPGLGRVVEPPIVGGHGASEGDPSL